MAIVSNNIKNTTNSNVANAKEVRKWKKNLKS
jgi:hypothetical protein